MTVASSVQTNKHSEKRTKRDEYKVTTIQMAKSIDQEYAFYELF